MKTRPAVLVVARDQLRIDPAAAAVDRLSADLQLAIVDKRPRPDTRK